jgi:hypothetical protein
LQTYIKLGVEVTSVKKVIQFKQGCWLKPYIEKNTEKRKLYPKGSFFDMYFKRMNNAVFGKFLEDVRNQLEARLYTKLPDLNKMSYYSRHVQFDEDMVGIFFEKKKVLLNKPIIVGQTILDISKMYMYDFFYNMKERYNDMTLLMSDTDSLLLDLPEEFLTDVVEDQQLHRKFDFSEYPNNHPVFKHVKDVDKYKKDTMYTPGLMKDETKGVEILEFVGLSAKVYSYKLENNTFKKAAKGIKKSTFNDAQMRHERYKEILFSKETDMIKFESMKTKKHVVYWETVCKKGLSAFDNKFYYIDGTTSLPYGHYKIRNI